MKVTLTTPDHINELAQTMRKEDREEVWAAAHLTPLRALEEGYQGTPECYTALDSSGRVIAIGGITPTDITGWAGAWLLASDLMAHHGPSFMKFCEAVKNDAAKKGYIGLTNFVDRRNVLHIRWLEAIGATFDRVMLRGPENMEFVQFYIFLEAPPCA